MLFVLGAFRLDEVEHRLGGVVDRADDPREAVVAGGRESRTHFRVLERFPRYTLVEARLETGRTHQIRVHMAAIGYPTRAYKLLAFTIAGAIAYLSEMAMWSMFLGGGRNQNAGGDSLIIAIVGMILAPIAALLVQLSISRSRDPSSA